MNLNEAITVLTNLKVNNIHELDDLPNDVGGLSAQQLKDTFDKASVDLKAFLLDLIVAIIDGDEAAARGITQQGMPGSMIQNNSITAEKLMSIVGAEAVTTANMRDGQVTEPKLGSELALKINNTVAGVESNLSKINSNTTNISRLQTTINTLSSNKQDKHRDATVTIPTGTSGQWIGSVDGVKPGNLVFLAGSTVEDCDEVSSKKIFCVGQATNSLTFSIKRATTKAVTLNVAIFD